MAELTIKNDDSYLKIPELFTILAYWKLYMENKLSVTSRISVKERRMLVS